MIIYRRKVYDNSSTLVSLKGIRHLVLLIKDNFQPKGDYLTMEQAKEKFLLKSYLNRYDKDFEILGYLTEKQSDSKYQLKGDYAYKSELSQYATKKNSQIKQITL